MNFAVPGSHDFYSPGYFPRCNSHRPGPLHPDLLRALASEKWGSWARIGSTGGRSPVAILTVKKIRPLSPFPYILG